MNDEYRYTIIDEATTWGFSELCSLCRLEGEIVRQMVNEGVVIPEGSSPDTWRFNSVAIRRIQVTQRLQNDLRVNLPGAALALDLLEELDELRSKLKQIP